MQAIPFYKAELELRQLPHACLRQLAHLGRLVRFKPNSQVLTQGQTSQDVFIVLEGRLEAYVHSNGRKERRLTLASLHAGDLFGEIGLDGGPRTASVCTVTSSLCAMIDKDVAQEQRKKDPALQCLLAQTANQRNRMNTQLVAQTVFNDIYTRLVDLLMMLSKAQSPRIWVIEERVTHQEIANRLGCSREMVSRLLKDLERGKYIARRKDHSLVLYPPLPLAW
jgi:CRP/FNR family cyclic AMP-dependent transcriptional regulator